MADNKTEFGDLKDFSGTGEITPMAAVYGMLFRKSGNNTKTAYKFKVQALSSFFLLTKTLTDIEAKVKNFRETFENLVETYCTMEYLEENEYVTKYTADKMRKTLATEETLKSKIQEYVTKPEMETDLKEAERDGTETVNSYATSMMTAASTARSVMSTTNILETKLDDVSEGISDLNPEEKEDEENNEG